MRPIQLRFLLASLFAVLLLGCAFSDVRQGGSRAPMGGMGRVFLAPIHNATPAETAHTLIATLSNPETCVKMGVAARKRAEQFYGMTTMLGDYRDLHNELAGKSAATPAPANADAPSPRRPKGLP